MATKEMIGEKFCARLLEIAAMPEVKERAVVICVNALDAVERQGGNMDHALAHLGKFGASCEHVIAEQYLRIAALEKENAELRKQLLPAGL